MSWAVEALTDTHELADFDCGNEELTRWLRDHARQATRQGTRTYVVVTEDHVVLGDFSLAPHLLEREELQRSIGRGAPRRIPSILLAKLALDRTVQGRGLGSELLVIALTSVVEAARVAGGKIVVVDAIDNAAVAFYQHHDFIPVPGNPRRLVQKLSTVAGALRLPWP